MMKVLTTIAFILISLVSNSQPNIEKEVTADLSFEAKPLTLAPEISFDPFERTIQFVVKDKTKLPILTPEFKNQLESLRVDEDDVVYKYNNEVSITIFSHKKISDKNFKPEAKIKLESAN